MRFFNTAGPVNCKDHYCLSPLERFDLEGIVSLIDQKKYFVLHAPRQTGKTTCLLALMDHLNAIGKYRCLYFNVESAQAAREDVRQGMRAILDEMASSASDYLEDDFLESHWQEALNKSGEYGALTKLLSLWAKEDPLPLVILMDEIDALVGDTLISVLRQLRSGYHKRPGMFPQSVVLCGVRDVRDYRIHSTKEKSIITGGSAFNIKAKSLRLGNFSRDEMYVLYQQHTEETGQVFVDGTMDLLWELTGGQPWLVNALGYEVCFEMKEGSDRKRPITVDMIEQAKENIILRRETHIDQLADKLQEPRVRQVIEPLLEGLQEPEQITPDNLSYVIDLGLIKIDGQLQIANRIYQEVIPRVLTYSTQVTISEQPSWYIKPNGQLDMDKLLDAFQQFFREHSEHWVERFQYKEAGPQLLLQAFLQRIVNGGGRVEREYGLGRMRTDLLIIWPHKGGVQKEVIELKILYKSLDETINQGLKQTTEYMVRCHTDKGHLVIFDRSEGKNWEQKIFKREEDFQGKKIMVWGM
ncbi:MAG: ATP-binding protein [Deltaproteobacteria bacterium]|nr:ATP-binding protein [Deltaproteobacteria bacterium]